MITEERLATIQDLVFTNIKATVSELSELCNVTEETIRKDLNKLEHAGTVTRVRGGAIYNQAARLQGIRFVQRRAINLREKRVIARRVCEYLVGKSSLFADSSTTVAEALKALPQEADLTVVSNSTEIFLEVAQKNLNLISTGGDFNKKYLSLQGSVAKECIKKYNVDVALISCKTLDMTRGVQDTNENEAELKKLMIDHAKEVVLLADHDKFDKTAFLTLIPLDKVNCLVTDQEPPARWVQYCGEHGITLIY